MQTHHTLCKRMKIKKTALSGSLVAIAAAAAIMSSCSREVELINPNQVVQDYSNGWDNKFGNIDENQDWNLATTATVNIRIKEDALSDYSLQIYSANPIADENAKIMANIKVTTDANGFATASFDMDIAKGVKEVYAARMDSHNRRIYKVANVVNGCIDVTFGSVPTRSMAKTRSANDNSENEYSIPAFVSPYPTANDVENEITTGGYDEFYTKLSEVWCNSGDKVVVRISDTQTCYWPGVDQANKILIVIENGGKLVFEANNWNSNSWSQAKYDIIVKDGGELYMNNANADCGLGFARLIVQKGGKVTGKRLSTGNPQNNVATDGIWNEGTIELDWLNLAKGNIYNNGVMKITTFDTSNGGRITNNGRVECETFGWWISNQGGEIWTNCLFRCKTYMKGSNFRIGANAALEAQKVEVHGNLDLNKNAILRASEYGIIGNCTINAPTSTGDFALVSMPTLYYYDNNEHTTGKITGNLYFEYNQFDRSPNDATYWGGVLAEYMKDNAGAISKVGEAPLAIAGSEETDIARADCAGKGNNPHSKPTPDPEAPSWIIACEDLGNTNDYDFNDVVFKVSHVAGETTAYITPLAAGGVLETYIIYGTKELGETHQLLGSDKKADGSYPIINTYSITAQGQKIPVTVPSDFSMANNMGGFAIQVVRTHTNAITITAPTSGLAPQMFCVPGTWAWPKERVNIEDAYLQFANWSANSNNIEWYNSPVEGSTIK